MGSHNYTSPLGKLEKLSEQITQHTLGVLNSGISMTMRENGALKSHPSPCVRAPVHNKGMLINKRHSFMSVFCLWFAVK